MRASRVMPATLTTPWIAPVASSTCATARCTSSSRATFAATASGFTAARAAMSPAASCSRAASTSTSATPAPWIASISATARPMP
jgi:hypothetical protein